MTFLELCRAVRRETRIPGTGPDSVISPTGLIADVVAAVQAAWVDIQLHHYESWTFMNAIASAQLVEGRARYTFADLEVGDAARINGILDSVDESLERVCMRAIVSASTILPGQPHQWTLTPDNLVQFSPAPSQNFAVRVLYQRVPQQLFENNDTPFIPSHHHPVIIWKAVMDLAANESDSVIYQKALSKYEDYFSRLESDYLPAMGFNGWLGV